MKYNERFELYLNKYFSNKYYVFRRRQEPGWHETWVKDMNNSVGNICPFASTNKQSIILHDSIGNYYYPYSCMIPNSFDIYNQFIDDVVYISYNTIINSKDVYKRVAFIKVGHHILYDIEDGANHTVSLENYKTAEFLPLSYKRVNNEKEFEIIY